MRVNFVGGHPADAVLIFAMANHSVRRSMSLGGGDLQVAGSIVINTLSVTEKGEEILENPHAVYLPTLTQYKASQTSASRRS